MKHVINKRRGMAKRATVGILMISLLICLVTSCDSDETETETVPEFCDCIAGSGETFYEDNPTYSDPHDDTDDWTFTTPVIAGMNSEPLERAASELAAKPFAWSFVVLRGGAIVFEHYFNGSHARASNNVHSASKSILGAAIGIALEEKIIPATDTFLNDLIPGHYMDINDPQVHGINVRHLLTMTSALNWEEDSTEYVIEKQQNWIQGILELGTTAEPGTVFNYSTANTHLLSAALTEATGKSTCEFVHERLFNPMGIKAEHWGRDPNGYFSGGYNLYLTARELAKFGQLYLDNGRWGDQQIVPAQWVASSTQPATELANDYGYLFWLITINGYTISTAWGWGGQLVYIVPELDLVVVMTTDTANYEPDFDGASLLKRYVLPAVVD